MRYQLKLKERQMGKSPRRSDVDDVMRDANRRQYKIVETKIQRDMEPQDLFLKALS